MLDIGNFVLVNKNSTFEWESFKNPTDTLLPNQSLELDGKLTSPPLPSLGAMESLSRALSVLTSLSLKISHSPPAHNKHTSFSHTKIVIVIIIIIYYYQMKISFWGLEFYGNRKQKKKIVRN